MAWVKGLTHFIFIANQWAFQERFACPTSEVGKMSPREGNDLLFKVNVWAQRALTKHWLHLNHGIAPLATATISGIPLFAERFVFMRYLEIHSYWSFIPYHWGGWVASSYFLEKEIGVRKAYMSHAVGISAGTKTQGSWLPVQHSLHSSTFPWARDQTRAWPQLACTLIPCLGLSTHSPYPLKKRKKKKNIHCLTISGWCSKTVRTVFLSQFLL